MRRKDYKSGPDRRILPVAAAAAAAFVVAVLLFSVKPSPMQVNALDVNALNSTGSPVGAISVVLNGMGKVKEVNVTYSGFLNLSYKSDIADLNFSVPVSAMYSRFMNSSKYRVNLSVGQLMMNLSVVGISLGNGAGYSCHRYAFAVEGQGNNFTCVEPAEDIAQSIEYVIGQGGKARVVGQSSYMGHNCTLVVLNGTLSEPQGNGTYQQLSKAMGFGGSPYNYSVRSCISDRYALPLNLSGKLQPVGTGATVTISIFAVHIRNVSNVSYVESLPPHSIYNTVISGALTGTNYT